MFFEVGSLIFFASDNFQGNFVDFRFMRFTQILMKELARILTHIRKIFICRLSFKILLPMYLAITHFGFSATTMLSRSYLEPPQGFKIKCFAKIVKS